MLSTKLKEAAGNSADATLYVDDVFSTYLYVDSSSNITINNGIDLAGKGGLVWLKSRNGTSFHRLIDTARGAQYDIYSNSTSAQQALSEISSFNSNGFTTGNQITGGENFVSWTFRKAAKFFDVVTYTGNGVAGRSIAHSLQSTPAIIFIKATNNTSSWFALCRKSDGNYARGASSYNFALDTTEPAENYSGSSYQSNASVFYPSDVRPDANNETNANGYTYVAYLFAHDTSSTGIIQCGSFTTPGQVNLGWEPQYLLYKKSDGTSNWIVYDSMRGFGADTSNPLYPNLSVAEGTGDTVSANATGFNSPYSGSTYIYMAIRMPNKPPTTGTQVFNTVLWTGNQTNNRQITGVGFNADYVEAGTRNTATAVSRGVVDRLRGTSPYLMTYYPTYEQLNSDLVSFDNDGITVNYVSSGIFNNSSDIYGHFFKRAPGFFDVVCYTGTGVATTQAHNLGVAPELMIVKCRSTVTDWGVYNSDLGNTKYLWLDSTNSASVASSYWNNTSPTPTNFSVKDTSQTNTSGATYVAYLFATLAGISKVGSYTGNGTSQNIECGFAAGARFFLVKATSTTGSWWVWDSARGITSGNDPALQLNSTAAEITTADAVDPYSPGITVNQEATCSINASGVSYVYLAIS